MDHTLPLASHSQTKVLMPGHLLMSNLHKRPHKQCSFPGKLENKFLHCLEASTKLGCMTVDTSDTNLPSMVSRSFRNALKSYLILAAVILS